MAQAKKTIVQFAQTDILSLKDGAYKQAQATDTVYDFAQYVIGQHSGFGTSGFKLPDEAKLKELISYKNPDLKPYEDEAVLTPILEKIPEGTKSHQPWGSC